MKKMLFFFFLLFLNDTVTIAQEECACLRRNKYTADQILKRKASSWVCKPDETCWWYKYYLNELRIQRNLIKDPLYYYEYHNNLMLYNQTVISGIKHCTEHLIRLEIDCRGPCPKVREETEKRISNLKKYIIHNYMLSDKIKLEFSNCYNECLARGHDNRKDFYDRAFIAFMDGNAVEAAEAADKYLTQVKDLQNLDSKKLFLLGQFNIDLAQFSEAINLLSMSIEKDPSNKSAYFYRSTAYFETGEFDKALQDYLLSNRLEEVSTSVTKASLEFTQAFIDSLKKGFLETATDFIPSICKSVYGLGDALWTTAQHPIETTSNFASLCYDVSLTAYEQCKNINWDTVDGYAYEFRYLCDNFMQSTEKEKGEQIGYLIGRYGTEIFAGTTTCKGLEAFRNLQRANRVYNLEAMALSNINKEATIASALKREEKIKTYFKDIKIETDKQNKHIIGKHNFQAGKGEFTHNNPQELLNKFAGKGKAVNNKYPGSTDYRERVDFGEIIGYYVHQDRPEVKIPTTKGIIHYSKNGAHIIPSNPIGN